MALIVGNAEGSWGSYVSLQLQSRLLRHVVGRALAEGPKSCPNGEKFSPNKSLHISLSKQFYLRAHHIDPFVAALGLALGVASRFHIRVGSSPFVLSNESAERHFLCVPVADLTGALLRLVDSVSDVLAQYRQPRYYEAPIFHVSVAHTGEDLWSNGGCGGDEEGEDDDDEDDDEDVEVDEAGAPVCSLQVSTVWCRIGNRRFRLDLGVRGAGFVEVR